MEDFIARIQEVSATIARNKSLPDPQYDQAVRSLGQLLASIPTTKLTSRLSTGENILDILDPSVQSLAYTHILSAHLAVCCATPADASGALPPSVLYGGELWPYMSALIEHFDPIQIRYVGAAFRRILELVGQGAIETQNPLPAVKLLQLAILRLDRTSSTLTSVHHLFLRTCLHSRVFHEALPILEKAIYHIPSNTGDIAVDRPSQYLCRQGGPSLAYLNPGSGLTSNLTSRHYLEYHLFGAMVYMALKRWAKAISFLEIVLSAPATNALSMIMVEAYKKYLLAGLLLDGQSHSVPPGMHRNRLRVVQALTVPYNCLVDAFSSHNPTHLYQIVEEGHPTWLNDCNHGLVVQVVDAFRKFSILRLADVYVALPVAEVAHRTSGAATDLSETAAYISTLIDSGQLQASFTESASHQQKILRFVAPSSVPQTESHLYRDLQNHQAELQEMLQQLGDSDHRLELCEEFIKRLRSLKQRQGSNINAGAVDAGGNSLTLEDWEEDLMDDV